MILELFKVMLKEEVRIHTELFPKFFFFLFPFIAFFLSFILSILISDVSFLKDLFFIIVFFAGVTSGAYGLETREIYLRKFPHLNFLLYSYFAMPIKNEIIFFSMFLKEVTFSFFWFLLPFIIGLSNFNVPIIANSIVLFLFANSLSFFLSNILNNKKIFYPVFLIVAVLLAISFGTIVQNLWLEAILFIATFILSMKTIDLEYYSKKIFHRDMFDKVFRLLKSPLVTKDLIDLKRSYGFARIIVSIILPIIVVYMLLAIFERMIGPNIGELITKDIFYSLMFGLVSLAVYDTFVEFDRWDFYSILPLKKSDLIKSKLKSSLLISFPLIFVLILILTGGNLLLNLLIASVSTLYFISIIVYLVGLDTRLLIDVRNLLIFSIFFIPYFMLVFLSVQIYAVLIASVILSLILLRFGIRKFDSE